MLRRVPGAVATVSALSFLLAGCSQPHELTEAPPPPAAELPSDAELARATIDRTVQQTIDTHPSDIAAAVADALEGTGLGPVERSSNQTTTGGSPDAYFWAIRIDDLCFLSEYSVPTTGGAPAYTAWDAPPLSDGRCLIGTGATD